MYIWSLYIWHTFQCHKTNSLKVKSLIWEPLFSTTSVTKNDFMKPLSGKICISPGLPVTNIRVCSKTTLSSHGGQWQDLVGKLPRNYCKWEIFEPETLLCPKKLANNWNSELNQTFWRETIKWCDCVTRKRVRVLFSGRLRRWVSHWASHWESHWASHCSSTT